MTVSRLTFRPGLRRRFASLSGCALIALSACVPTTPADTRPTLPEPGNDTCSARSVANLIGQNESMLVAVTGRRDPVRIIRPGRPVTMDYIETRLNIELSDAGIVERMTCG